MADDVATIPAVRTKLAIAKAARPEYIPGRRDFFKYRELGITEATDGFMRSQVMIGSKGMTQPTGWHYHICDAQFVYVLKGWVELQFEETGTVRLEAGDSINIPGYLPHNEIRTSDELEILEVSVPAALGTQPCEIPAGFKA